MITLRNTAFCKGVKAILRKSLTEMLGMRGRNGYYSVLFVGHGQLAGQKVQHLISGINMCAIFGIAQNWGASCRHMNTKLVGAPRARHKGDKRQIAPE